MLLFLLWHWHRYFQIVIGEVWRLDQKITDAIALQNGHKSSSLSLAEGQAQLGMRPARHHDVSVGELLICSLIGQQASCKHGTLSPVLVRPGGPSCRRAAPGQTRCFGSTCATGHAVPDTMPPGMMVGSSLRLPQVPAMVFIPHGRRPARPARSTG